MTNIPHQPAFSLAEYVRRLDAIRDRMQQRGLDALLLFSPHAVNYLSGMDTENMFDFQCLIVPLDGRPTLVILDFERGRYENSAWVEHRVLFDSATNEDPLEATVQVLREQGLGAGRLGVEQRHTPLSPSQLTQLAGALPRATLEDPFPIVEEVRLVKSEEELRLMRQAAALTDKAVQAAYGFIRAGVRDGEVAAAMMQALYGEGGDTVPWGPIVAAGYRSGLPHSTFNGYTIQSGDTVFLEVTGSCRRYTSPLMRTAVVGRPTDSLRRLENAARGAIEAIQAAARPGVPASELSAAGLRHIAPVESDVIFHYNFGYPVGLAYYGTWIEQLGFFLRSDNPRPVQAGMVFHLPMSLRVYGQYCVNLSQAMLVTATGGQPLGQSPARLEVL